MAIPRLQREILSEKYLFFMVEIKVFYKYFIHTRKLGEITIFYAVLFHESLDE